MSQKKDNAASRQRTIHLQLSHQPTEQDKLLFLPGYSPDPIIAVPPDILLRAAMEGFSARIGTIRNKHLSRAYEAAIEWDSPSRTDAEGEPSETITREADELFIQNEILKSRLADEQRRAREAIQERDLARLERDRILDFHHSLSKTNEGLLEALMAKSHGVLCIYEAYRGIVEHVGEDTVCITYETDQEPIEHVYHKSQFLQSRIPNEDDRVAIYVFVTEVDTDESQSSEDGIAADAPKSRKNVVSGRYFF